MYLTSLSTFNVQVMRQKSFPGGSDSKASVYNVVDPGSIPGLGRSPGEGNPLQYSWLGNPMVGVAWQATVHEVAESDMTEHTKSKKENKEKPVHAGFKSNIKDNWGKSAILVRAMAGKG